MNIQDIISSSVVLMYLAPFGLYIITQNSVHIKAFLGVFGTLAITETLKKVFIKTLSPRPRGALNCNLLCNDGDQSGKPGMPSSHSSTVAFFASYYIQNTTNPIIKISLTTYAAFVMLSRYLKRCHSINQIGTGALLGILFSILIVRYL
jgi:membrane-associated phospholipid phosphatase